MEMEMVSFSRDETTDHARHTRRDFLCHASGPAIAVSAGGWIPPAHAQAGKLWAFNGKVEMPEEPLFTADRGESVLVRMVNDTAWPHAMHLHGHHSRKIGSGGRPGPLRDTLLMDRAETVEIGFVADNPRIWMLHCHMLEHSVSGMKT